MNGYPVNILHMGSYVSSSNSLPVNVAHFAPMQTDAFGRFRTSSPLTLFDSYHRYTDNGKISEYTSNLAYSTHNSNEGSILLTIGSNIGDRIYRESTRVFAYQPGKSLLILQTFCMNEGKIGLRQRHGYFDEYNGFYIQLNNTELSFVRRSYVTGNVLETIVPQDRWNYDSLRGTGPSSVILDITKCQILFIDIEWLGVGSARMGFVIDGKFCLCHIFHHANKESTINSNTKLPYMSTACLPVRSEVENIGNTGSYSFYRIICTSVLSEGGYELRGQSRTIGNDIIDIPYTLAVKNTFYPIVSIRLRQDRLGAIVIPRTFSLIGVTSSDFRWKLITNAIITGGNSWLTLDNSHIEYKLDGTTITGGIVIKSGYFTSTNGVSPVITISDDIFKFQLERNTFTKTAFTFTLAVAAKNINDKVLASMEWEEI